MRGLLGRADVGSVLAVRGRDLVRERDHEPLVLVDLLGRRLAFHQRDRLADDLQAVVLELGGEPSRWRSIWGLAEAISSSSSLSPCSLRASTYALLIANASRNVPPR